MRNHKSKIINIGLYFFGVVALIVVMFLRSEAEAETLVMMESRTNNTPLTIALTEEKPVAEEVKYERKTLYNITELNVRKGPSTEFDVEDVLSLGEEVTVYIEEGKEQEDWSLIDQESELYVCTRYLGTKEDVEKVREERRIKAEKRRLEEQKRKEAEIARANAQVSSVAMNTTSTAHTDYLVKSKSGLSAQQINQKLSSHPGLAGLGGAIKDIEDMYGINAYFTMAVASHESAYGTSNLARNNNNLFGFKSGNSGWAYFNSKSEAIYRFGATINKGYFASGRTTPASINPKYCPNDGGAWASKVVAHMNRYM